MGGRRLDPALAGEKASSGRPLKRKLHKRAACDLAPWSGFGCTVRLRSTIRCLALVALCALGASPAASQDRPPPSQATDPAPGPPESAAEKAKREAELKAAQEALAAAAEA